MLFTISKETLCGVVKGNIVHSGGNVKGHPVRKNEMRRGEEKHNRTKGTKKNSRTMGFSIMGESVPRSVSN